MRFKAVKAQSFGCLENWESGEITGNIAVIYGNNEAGKTTVFNLVNTILYGWSPSSRDTNPYIPWGSNSGECSAVLFTKDGKEMEIHRRLRSKAEGTLILGDRSINISNNPAAFVDFLPHEIFNEVYALTVDHLRFPNNTVWQKVQDQLLGGQYTSFLQPVHAVVSKLESESNSLWRPDRYGNPREKQLKEELKNLNIRLQQTQDNEKKMDDIIRELESIETEISTLLDKKAELTLLIDRSERLYPVKRKLEKVKELNEKAGNIGIYDDVPLNPMEIIKNLETQCSILDKKYRDVLEEKKEITKQLGKFTPQDRRIYENKDIISPVIKSYGQFSSDINTVSDLESETGRFKDRIKNKARECLQGGWNSETLKSLNSIDEAELRASIDSFKKINYDYKEQRARLTGIKADKGNPNRGRLNNLISLILLITGAAGFLLSSETSVKFVSIFAALSGVLIFFLLRSQQGGTNTGQIKEETARLNKINSLRESALNAVKSSLKGLNIAAVRLEEPNESLLVDVNTLKDLLFNIEDISDKKNKIDRRIKKGYEEILRILDMLLLPDQGDILKNINMLDNLLGQAQIKHSEYINSNSKLHAIESIIKDTENSLREAVSKRESIIDGIEELDGTCVEEKLLELEVRRDSRQKAKAILEELEHDYTDLGHIITEINNNSSQPGLWIFDEAQIIRSKTERDQLDARLNYLNQESGSIKKELEQRQEMQSVDDIRGEIAGIEAERKKNAFERDRLQLLKNIIQEADRQFREENQPDILQRAGNYLGIITGGRYDRLYINEGENKGLEVRMGCTGRLLEVGQPLSRGTREQIYLSLRLALLDHLDNEKESLPLFLDEALVNWDSIRLDNILELLNDISLRRQVFIFTCHKWFADKIESYNKGQIISLI